MFQLCRTTRKTFRSPSSATVRPTSRYFQNAAPCYGSPRGSASKGKGQDSAELAPFEGAVKGLRRQRPKKSDSLAPKPSNLISKALRAPRAKSTAKSKSSSEQPDNHIAAELYEKFMQGRKLLKPLGDKARMNIVSESLCDDVIQRLSRSLQKHKNCDIIDINPGVGLFSSKLHEALKPRNHVLMEPDEGIYMPYLQPLLDAKDSTYKLIPASGVIWANLDKLEEGDLLPHQKILSKDDPKLDQRNDTLLLVANLGYFPAKPFMGFTSIATLMIHQLLSAVRSHAIFQGYGLVRMLIWMSDKEKRQVLPRVVSQRKKSGLEAELVCENIFEIAGSGDLVGLDRREHALDLESARTVQRRMKQANITTPIARVGELQAEAAETSEASQNTNSSVVRPFTKELLELKARYARKEFPAVADYDGEPMWVDLEDRKQKTRGYKLTPEFERMCKLIYRNNQSNSWTAKVDKYIEEYEEITQLLEENIKAPDAVGAASEKKELLQRLETWREHLNTLPSNLDMLTLQRLEERRMLRQDPPVLLWDRREAEPLKVDATEFYPNQDMSLLDFHPKATWPIVNVCQGNLTNYDDFEFMVSGLFINPTQSVVKGLSGTAPGAAEWIIPRCPSLTNTANGGSVDLDNLSIRSMNEQMFREIFEAWMDWPFRLTKAEMLMRLGSANVTEDEDEDDNRMSGLASV